MITADGGMSYRLVRIINPQCSVRLVDSYTSRSRSAQAHGKR